VGDGGAFGVSTADGGFGQGRFWSVTATAPAFEAGVSRFVSARRADKQFLVRCGRRRRVNITRPGGPSGGVSSPADGFNPATGLIPLARSAFIPLIRNGTACGSEQNAAASTWRIVTVAAICRDQAARGPRSEMARAAGVRPWRSARPRSRLLADSDARPHVSVPAVRRLTRSK